MRLDYQEPARCGVSDNHRAHWGEGRRLDFFGADRAKIVYDALGALRAKIGHSEFGRQRGLSQEGWQLRVVDFPMFEFDEEAQRYVAAHHPFTSPKDGHEDHLATDPAQAMAKAYDMVLNGWKWAADRFVSTVKTCKAGVSR